MYGHLIAYEEVKSRKERFGGGFIVGSGYREGDALVLGQRYLWTLALPLAVIERDMAVLGVQGAKQISGNASLKWTLGKLGPPKWAPGYVALAGKPGSARSYRCI